MPLRADASDFVPDTADLVELADAARGCRGCALHLEATQTVFGAGPTSARVMLIGEQPGDQEDVAGRPFVGPAGRVLDQALAAAGIPRSDVYITTAVKHFKFTREERGKRRIHKTPSRTEVVACRPWLLAELAAVQPRIVVLLGATAAKALLGNDFRLTAHRGELLHLPPDVGGSLNPEVYATVHPSSILRGPPDRRAEATDALVADLVTATGGARPRMSD